MKTPIPLAIAFVGALLFMGCSKTEQVPLPAAVANSSFAEQMTYLLPLMDESRYLQVRYEEKPGGNLPVFYFQPKEKVQLSAAAIIGQSDNGTDLARRCDAWLAANPGKCLTIRMDGGTYYAEDAC